VTRFRCSFRRCGRGHLPHHLSRLHACCRRHLRLPRRLPPTPAVPPPTPPPPFNQRFSPLNDIASTGTTRYSTRRSSRRTQSARSPCLAGAASKVPSTPNVKAQTGNTCEGFSACIGLLLSAPSNNGTTPALFHSIIVTFSQGQRMAEFIILAATAAIVSLPSRLLSVCLLRYLKDDHLRSGLSFTPWPKIIAVCGVSVALAAVCSCVVVYMLPSWTSMLLRSPYTTLCRTPDPLCFMQP
jgi:hypothetical protein